MATVEAGDGDVWLACLPDPSAAGGWPHVGFAARADAAAELPGDVYAVSAGYPACQ